MTTGDQTLRNDHRREARRFLRVLTSRRKHAAALVLAVIIDQIDLELRLEVSAEGLSDFTGLNRPTLFREIGYLEAEGMLERIPGKTKNTYRIRVENVGSHRPDVRHSLNLAGNSLHRPDVRDSLEPESENHTVPMTTLTPSRSSGHEGTGNDVGQNQNLVEANTPSRPLPGDDDFPAAVLAALHAKRIDADFVGQAFAAHKLARSTGVAA